MQAAPTEAQVARLYEQHASLVFARCRRVLRNEDNAWGATQEVFAKAIAHWSRFDGNSTRGTWLYRIATNHCLHVIRDSKGRRASRHPLDEDAMSRLDTLLNRPEPPVGPSRHALARLVAGDLPADEDAELRRMVAASPKLRERLDALRDADARFLAARPFESVKAELFDRAGATPPAPSRDAAGLFGPFLAPRSLMWAIAAVVMALGLMLVMPSEPDGAGDGPAPAANRLKGGVLTAFQDVGGRAVAVPNRGVLEPGDLVQFRVESSKPFIALLGVDGTGTVSRYVPVGGDLSAARTPGVHALDDALMLDDAPGPEVFLAFLSDDAVLVEDLERVVHDVIDAVGVHRLVEHRWEGEVGVFVARKAVSAP